MKILIADKFEAAGVAGLRALGCEVVLRPDLGAEGMAGGLTETRPDILIVRSTKVQASAIGAAEGLKGIIRAGAGVDNIDVSAATARGIAVCNCPGMNSVAVAELTFALLLACDRRLPDQTAALKAGKWDKKEFSKARGLKGMTLGVVGAGAIGRAVIRRALAFEMKVMAWSRSITPDHARDIGAEFGGTDTPALLALAARADAVTVHLPLTDTTRGLFGREFFGAMRPGSYFINTSRGQVVDEAALRDAVKAKGLRAGLDVYCDQPGESEGAFASETAALPGVYGTHHVGASTDQAQLAVAMEVVRIVKVYKETGRAENAVNMTP